MRAFGEENGFSFNRRQTHPDKRFILIEMSRNDMMLLSLNSFEPEKFDISFYKNHTESPDPDLIERLATNLRIVIGKIQGVTITGEE